MSSILIKKIKQKNKKNVQGLLDLGAEQAQRHHEMKDYTKGYKRFL